MKTNLIVLLIFLYNQKVIEALSPGEWSYVTSKYAVGPSEWNTVFPSCGGKRQSPIDIQSKYAKYMPNMLPISIEKLQNPISYYTLAKSQRTITLYFSEDWKITFGNDKCLKPVGIHWHWGSNNNQGSEHYLNGKRYPLEGHLVSFNCDIYTSFEKAKYSKNGLYVIGIFYKMGKSNRELETIISSMQNENWETTGLTNLTEIDLTEFLPNQLDKYYQYDGSLTTPPCTENVKWTILNEELTVSESQLDTLRNMMFDLPNGGNMMDNFRPPVSNPKNARPIYMSFKNRK